jgi:flagellar biosynthetic protein FlhB
MSDEDKESKTEEPSSKRLEEAAQKGDLPFSREVGHFLVLIILAFTVGAWAPSILRNTKALLTPFITDFDAMPTDPYPLGHLFMSTVYSGLGIIAIPVGCVMLSAFIAKYMQSGFGIYWQSLSIKWSKLSPMKGLKKLFSTRTIVEFIKNLIKVTIVGIIAYISVEPLLKLIRQLPDSSLLIILSLLSKMAVNMCIGVAIALSFIALFDFLYQKYEFNKSLRMTKQEVKDEYKQQEGDPKVKGQIKRLRIERAMKRMMADVPKSDVVITNPTHFAVALKYDPKAMKAPTITAKGQDLIALRIRQVAEENNVPVIENPPLARALFSSAEIGEEIPTAHYEAVAKIISYVFGLKNKKI